MHSCQEDSCLPGEQPCWLVVTADVMCPHKDTARVILELCHVWRVPKASWGLFLSEKCCAETPQAEGCQEARCPQWWRTETATCSPLKHRPQLEGAEHIKGRPQSKDSLQTRVLLTATATQWSPWNFLQGPDCYPETPARKPASGYQPILAHIKTTYIKRNRKMNLLTILPKTGEKKRS